MLAHQVRSSFLTITVATGLMLVGFVVCAAGTTKKPLSAHKRQGIPSFAINFYRSIAGTQDSSKNIAVSPLSLEASLTVVHEAAGGSTQTEIAAVLATASMSSVKFYEKMRAINQTSDAGCTVLSASGMYLEKTYGSQHVVLQRFGTTELGYVDFIQQAELNPSDNQPIRSRDH